MTRQAELDLELDFQLAISPRGIPDAAFFAGVARAALEGQKQRAVLTLRLVGRREGRRLNRQFRAIDKPTNVLAFPFSELAELVPDFLGDIVICAPVAADEARLQHKTRRAHYAHLLVHGLLHLLGFDHLKDRDAELMEQRERGVMSKLGFADPYAA